MWHGEKFTMGMSVKPSSRVPPITARRSRRPSSSDRITGFFRPARIDRPPWEWIEQGRLYVVWYTEGTDEIPAVYIAFSDDRGRTFSTKRKLNRAANTFPDHPQIAVDPQGRLVVVWEEQAPVKRDVVMSVSTDRGATFTAPQKVNEKKSQTPVVAVNAEGLFALGLDGTWHARSQDRDADAADAGCRAGDGIDLAEHDLAGIDDAHAHEKARPGGALWLAASSHGQTIPWRR